MPEQSFKDKIFELRNADEFYAAAMELFHHQAEHNTVYADFLKALRIDHRRVSHPDQIPFLPISFFKTHEVKTGIFQAETVFTSSATSSGTQSRHFVKKIDLYERSFNAGFELFYGKPDDLAILALLPAYLDRTGSSLVYMAEKLIKKSKHPESGFFLNDYGLLIKTLRSLAEKGTPTLLLGVSFALLDLAEMIQDFHHPRLIVMETGGMKGRRKEMVREELHQVLKAGFHAEHIHSEYGMTELLSQAYSSGEGKYTPVPWMKIAIRDVADPLSLQGCGKTGGVNVIDLANVYSCAFIATDDLGRLNEDGTFEILGRFDQAEIRGCNLMVT